MELSKICEIDVWSNVERTLPAMGLSGQLFETMSYHQNEFIATITVQYEDNIQDIRERIRQMLPNPPDKIDLKIIRMEPHRKPSDISVMMQPTWPCSILHSDKSYTVRQVIDNTPTSYAEDDESHFWFSLIPLERVMFEAVDYNN
jgi:hypothetical protein